MVAQLTEHRLQLDDRVFYYKQAGDIVNSTPILFLHGWGISTDPYMEVLTLLAATYGVIAPDLPSFARSTYPRLIQDYETYSRLLLSFLDQLQLERVHLVGHSIGGGIAIALSALAPERVKSAILVDSTGAPTVSLLEIVPRRAFEMVAQISPSKLHLQLVNIPQFFSYILLFNTGNVIQALLLSLQASLRHLLPAIQTPCLLLWSEHDLTTPLASAEEMASAIPNAQLVTVKEGWHEWALWHPEKFTSIVLNFIAQVELTS